MINVKSKLICKGELLNNRTKMNEIYSVEYIDISEIDQMMALQEETMENLEDKSLFAPNDEDDMGRCFDDTGYSIGVYVDGNLIGFRTILYVDDNEEGYWWKAKISPEEKDRVVIFDRTIIKPEYRGNKLQQVLMLLALKQLKREGEYRYVVATVSSKNVCSMKSLMNMGFKNVNHVRMYHDNYDRLIMLRDLSSDSVRS